MTREPSAASLVAEGFSRIADAVGVVLLCWLGWRMFFVFDSALQGRALVVGLVGTLACWTDRSAPKNAPLAMIAYVAIGLLSAATPRWTKVSSSPDSGWLVLFTPALHLAVMAVFVYGAAYLLRTPLRLSRFVVCMVAAIGVLAIQIAFDRASVGFVYERGGPSLPSVPHWSGIHGASLFLTLGLPLIVAISVSTRSVSRLVAGGLAGGSLMLVAFLNGSRGGLVSTGFVIGAMAVFALIDGSRFRFRALVLWLAVATLAICAAGFVWSQREGFKNGADLSGRTLIWKGTAKLALERPFLGVGPGSYAQAMADSGHDREFRATHGGGIYSAHNLYLHVAAETGVISALCLVGLLTWSIWACWRSWAQGHVRIVSLGVMFALLGFLAHSASEDFLDARPEVERTRLLVWMILAAALALQHLPRLRQAGRA